jgi:orotate phosphoribosyltransferase
MKRIDEQLAELLLQSKAIKLQPTNPFTWASGWKSPIYCDNRVTLSFPGIRKFITDGLAQLLKEKYPDAQVVAGVATGAIAQAALVAENLGLPLVYVRPEAKKHGLGNQVEGYLEKNAKTVVVEDLISTGKSSLAAVDALRLQGAEVLGMVAIFTYGFAEAQKNFEGANCPVSTLSNYPILIEIAMQTGYIDPSHAQALGIWREKPAQWKNS